MKHLKKASALALCLALALSLAACAAAPKATDGNATNGNAGSAIPDDAVVAKVGEREITRGELADQYNSMLAFYANYGMAAPTTEEELSQYQDMALEGLVANAILLHQAELMGLSPLSGEDAAEAQAAYEGQIADLYASFVSLAEQEGAEDTDVRAVEIINEQLAASGRDVDYEGYQVFIKKMIEEQKVLENLEKTFKASIEEDPNAGQGYYDDLVATQAELYKETPSEYLTAAENYEMFGGTPVLVAPEGYVRIKVLSIEPEAEADAQKSADIEADKGTMATLEAEYGKLALESAGANKARMNEISAEYKTLSEKVAAATADYMKEARAKADEAMAKLVGGADFDTVLKEYGDDEAYETYEAIGRKGRLMELDGDDGWAEALHAAVKALENGAYSGIVEGDDALYIVQRVSDEPAATAAYEDVADEMVTLAADEKREAAWTEQQESWVEDKSAVTYFEENYRDIGA